MRLIKALSISTLALLAFTGCTSIYGAVNGAEQLREESWQRSDGAECTTSWTLTVVSGFDRHDGPIDAVREAYELADPTADDLAWAEEAVSDEESAADDALRLEQDAYALATRSAAESKLIADGHEDELNLYEFGAETVCA